MGDLPGERIHSGYPADVAQTRTLLQTVKSRSGAQLFFSFLYNKFDVQNEDGKEEYAQGIGDLLSIQRRSGQDSRAVLEAGEKKAGQVGNEKTVNPADGRENGQLEGSFFFVYKFKLYAEQADARKAPAYCRKDGGGNGHGIGVGGNGKGHEGKVEEYADKRVFINAGHAEAVSHASYHGGDGNSYEVAEKAHRHEEGEREAKLLYLVAGIERGRSVKGGKPQDIRPESLAEIGIAEGFEDFFFQDALLSGRGVFFIFFGKMTVHFLPEGVQTGIARLFHAAEGPEVKKDQEENEAAGDEKADMLKRPGRFIHNHACKKHGGYGNEYGDGVFARKIAAAQIHGHKRGNPVLSGGCADLCAGLGKKVSPDNKELCGTVFQRQKGNEENKGEEELLEHTEADKKLPFFELVDFLHGEKLKKGGKACHGGDDPNGSVRDIDGEH